MSRIEYRICWSADSNASFEGKSEWKLWPDDDATDDEIKEHFDGNRVAVPDGLALALECSGFEWWAETRSAETGLMAGENQQLPCIIDLEAAVLAAREAGCSSDTIARSVAEALDAEEKTD